MTNTEPIAGPAYRIITPRLLIRCPEPADAPALQAAIQESKEHLSPWMLWANEPAGLQERIEFLRKSRGNFDLGIDFGYLIFNRQGTILIGGTGLHTRLGKDAREIGYWIHKDHIHQGYATEVASALTRIAFDVDHISRVEIHCSPHNTRSANIPRKLGFIHEATLHNRIKDVDGHLRDSMIWSMFAESYPASPCAKIELQALDALGRFII
jgi:RimJ/RimL family protein N-acetyltransferase